MFKLHKADGFEQFGEDASFYFNEAGLLVVDSDKVRRIYSPLAWTYIETDTPDDTEADTPDGELVDLW